LGLGCWGGGVGVGGLGPTPQSPIPNPHHINLFKLLNKFIISYFITIKLLLNLFNLIAINSYEELLS